MLARPDHTGDVLLTLPAAAALKQALPSAHISYMVPARSADVVSRCPFVDEVMVFPFPDMRAPHDPDAWAEMVALHAPALEGRFDMALVFREDDPWSGRLVAAAAIPSRLGYDFPRTRPFLTEALPVQRSRHVAATAFELAAAAAARYGRPWLDPPKTAFFVPTRQDEEEAQAVLVPSVGPKPIVLHPGSGWRLKNWLPSRWAILAQRLKETCGRRPLVMGTPSEQPLVDGVVGESGEAATALQGSLSLGALAAVHRRAALVVSTDNGALHLPAIMGAPVVGIYGPADSAMFGPLCPPSQHRIIRVPLPCSPCGTLIDPPCGAAIDPACITGISVEAVLRACQEIFNGRSVRAGS